VSFDFNVSCSSCGGYSLINTLKLKFEDLASPWWVEWWKEQDVGLMRQRSQDLAAQQFKSRTCWPGVQKSWLYCTSEAHSGKEQTFSMVYTRERVRIDRKSTGGPPAHRGQPAHRRSSAQVLECSSSEHSKNTDALKKPQWLDNARYRNTQSGPSLVTPVARGSGREQCKTRDTHSTWL